MRGLRNVLLSMTAHCLKWRRPFASMFEDSSILVLPASRPGSMGDEAMLISLLLQARIANVARIGLITYTPDDIWHNIPYVDEVMCLPRRKSEWLGFLNRVSKYSHLYINGADVLDGYYSVYSSLQRIRLVSLACNIGLRATITGFSFREDPSPETVVALKRLPDSVRLCARDPVSYRRLQKLLLPNTEFVADLAFLLEPDIESSMFYRIKQLLSERLMENRIVVGINFNRQVFATQDDISVKSLCKTYVYLIGKLLEWDARIFCLLIPHDFRGEHSDLRMVQEIHSLLPETIRNKCACVDQAVSAGEIKAIVSLLDVAFSGRMHLAIACMGQGVPVGCLSYQGKFEGMYEHFGLKNMIINPDVFKSNKDIALDFLKSLLTRRKEIHNKLQKRLNMVKRLAKRNFDESMI